MRTLAFWLFVAIGVATFACHPRISDGPFEGRVVDFHLGYPIEGAVVAAFWYRRTAMIAADQVTPYFAQETVTDAEGRFRLEGIRGWNLRPLSKIEPARLIIFAPGYEACNRTAPAAEGGCGLPNVRLRSLTSFASWERRRDSVSPGQSFEHWVPLLVQKTREDRASKHSGRAIPRQEVPHDDPP